jgi:hypothetical protein
MSNRRDDMEIGGPLIFGLLGSVVLIFVIVYLLLRKKNR